MDVALIRWPSDESLRLELARLDQPRLLLVETDADPPQIVDPLEDWVRLPVSRADRLARVQTLEARANDVRVLPTLSEHGTLEYHGRQVHLSEMQAGLIVPLIVRFGTVVGRDTLIAAAWPDADASSNNLDVTMGRLRRQISAVGLRLHTVRSRGYYLSDSDPV